MAGTKKELLEAIEIEREKYSEEDFDSYIDEVTPVIEILGMQFTPSTVIQEIDPIGYRCELGNYQETETVYACPLCEEEFDDEDDAKYCCQTEDEDVRINTRKVKDANEKSNI